MKDKSKKIKYKKIKDKRKKIKVEEQSDEIPQGGNKREKKKIDVDRSFHY